MADKYMLYVPEGGPDDRVRILEMDWHEKVEEYVRSI